MAIETIWNNLGAASVYTTIAPFVFGVGMAHFKPWLPTEEAVRDRCKIRREALSEKTNQVLHVLLDKTLGLDITKLRGSPPKEIDFLNDFTAQVFRTFRVHLALECIEASVRKIYTALFVSAAVGLICLLLSLMLEGVKPYVALLGFLILFGQICAVARLRGLMKKLAEYEITT